MLDVTKEEQNGEYVVTKVDLKNTQGSGLGQAEIQVNNQDGMITITVPNVKKEFDLSLRKFIIAVSSDENIEKRRWFIYKRASSRCIIVKYFR